jgi:NAD(P)-dependent dehydrogenase (short-subunit alcohol dehydrogenase family)
VRASVTSDAELDVMARELERDWGGIDVLVNNAGMSEPFPLPLIAPAEWDRVMEVNAKGQFLATRAFIRGMIRRRGGSILNIGSLAGVRLIEAPVHYAASKAAARGFTQALAKEGRAPRHPRELPRARAAGGRRGPQPSRAPAEGLRRPRAVEGGGHARRKVARFAAFLVSDANGYMTGETIVMDGGSSVGRALPGPRRLGLRGRRGLPHARRGAARACASLPRRRGRGGSRSQARSPDRAPSGMDLRDAAAVRSTVGERRRSGTGSTPSSSARAPPATRRSTR